MALSELKSALPEYAKDIKLNITSVLSEEGAPGLEQKEIQLVALACAYSTKSEAVSAPLEAEFSSLSDTEKDAAKGAATIMAMNNIYYRFVHLSGDNSYSSLPANLRMSVIGKSGVEKKVFELMSLAVSAINGCGLCIESHVKQLEESGVSKQGIQSTVRIASVINAAAQATVTFQ